MSFCIPVTQLEQYEKNRFMKVELKEQYKPIITINTKTTGFVLLPLLLALYMVMLPFKDDNI